MVKVCIIVSLTTNIIIISPFITGGTSYSYDKAILLRDSGYPLKKESTKKYAHEQLNKNVSHRSNKIKSIDASSMLTLKDLILKNELSRFLFSVKENILPLPYSEISSNITLNNARKEFISGQDVSFSTEAKMIKDISTTELTPAVPISIIPELKQSVTDNFYKALDQLERKFYWITFTKLTSISPDDRKENGISFVQSTIFLKLMLIALSTEVDEEIRKEIYDCIELKVSYEDKINIINNIISTFPQTNVDLKFYWASRLELWPGHEISKQFENEVAPSLRLNVDRFNGTETPEEVARALNHMVENDSGGAIHDTFVEEDISEGTQAIFLTTLYLRGRWRSAPSLLNGNRLFKDVEEAPQRFVRCIRINDIMKYADLTEWDAEAVEIFYATPGLSLLLIIPRGRSLRRVAELFTKTNIADVTRRMHSLRIGITLPLYTLRMTLLLPNKLEAMGISKIMGVNVTNGSFTLSHAVQRIMFWAEAGRNAFKEDGIEWDEAPHLELIVDRPYIFFVRWNNLTIMNGNFVL